MDNNEPYFFNPGLSSEQIEDWLNQQRRCVAHYNKLKGERAVLTNRLSEIDTVLGRYANSFSLGRLHFPWDSNPLLEVNQNQSESQEDKSCR